MLDTIERPITLTARAKINLALHVTGRRSDGYHTLDSLVAFARFGDEVSVRAADEDCLHLSGLFADTLPQDETNLVIKARDALRRAFPGRIGPTAIHLDKRLPISSGIGGGSSDAATVLRSMMILWDVEPAPALLGEIAIALGADVPMCLHARPLLARGIGERVESIAGFPELPVVLVNPGVTVSTPQVFAALAKRDNAGLPDRPVFSDIDDVCSYLTNTDNHLYSAATSVAPAIGETMRALQQTRPRLARMSGSGATCFGLYSSDHEAEHAAAHLRREHPGWFVVDTTIEGV